MWFNGISLLIEDPLIPLKEKIILCLSHISWALSFCSMLWMITSMFLRYNQNIIVSLLSMLLLGAFLSTYMVGSWRNTQGLPLIQKWKYRLTNFILFPFANFFESIAIIYAIVRPIKTFEVIKK